MNENEQKKEALCAKKEKKNCLLLPNAHLHSQEKSLIPKRKKKKKKKKEFDFDGRIFEHQHQEKKTIVLEMMMMHQKTSS